MSVDAVTTEVILSRLREAASMMEYALYHSGYSTILRESQDGTAGITDAEGRPVMVSGGLQYHSLPYHTAVQATLECYPAASMRDGDSFVLNDPYKAGTGHAPDFVAITPVFHGGAIISFAVSIAHKADIGGIVPGSSGAAAREIFHDGMLLPPVRFQTADGPVAEVAAIIANNSRLPVSVLGDLRGQVGCTRLGAARIRALCDEFGAGAVMESVAHLLTSTGQRLRTALAGWRDGTAEAEGFLDHDGADRETPVRLHVRAEKSGDTLTLDFTGSGNQTAGPVNANAPTVRASALIAVLAAADPEIPMNAGLLDVVDFRLRPGSVVAPEFPATLNHYFPTCHLAYAIVLEALGKLNPERAVAPSGLGSGAVAVGYRKARSGKAAVQYELLITSLGATPAGDGASVIMAMNHYSPSTPVEILESEYPVRMRRFEMWPDSGGAGTQRGGAGFVREFELLEDCTFTVRTGNHRKGGWGVAGGKAPPLSGMTVRVGGAEAETLDCIETRQFPRGTVLCIRQTGGGGYGPPFARPVERVVEDVRNGLVSVAAAADDYGVVIDPETLEVDAAATAGRRES